MPNVIRMKRPPNTSKPFFAYGLFRPKQIGFLQLKAFLSSVGETCHIPGVLKLRDGLPIAVLGGPSFINGSILTFIAEDADAAYDSISALEPDEHYRWGEVDVMGIPANILIGRHPNKGSETLDGDDWDGWRDPLFVEALDVVEETMNAYQHFEWDLKPLFRLQMAYLLLWSSIERYASLRYGLGDRVVDKIRPLANEPAFAAGLRSHTGESRRVFRADQPDKSYTLGPDRADNSLNYYYQIRSNIVHRGKSVVRDHDHVSSSLKELLHIFRGVLAAAQKDAQP